MVVKLTWIFVGINVLVLLYFIVRFVADSAGRNVDSMESGWMTILLILAVLVILVGILPMRLSKSSFALYTSAFFAILPSFIGLWIFVSNKLPSFKKQKTMAETYYKDATQQSIAAAIEGSDTILLRELLKGQNLDIKGREVWDMPGLNYLQFAIRLRSFHNLMFNEQANKTAIRILVEQGSPTTPALWEAIEYLPLDMVTLLLDAGADPNSNEYTNKYPILFQAIGNRKVQNDIAIELVKKGATVNGKNDMDFTPIMFAATNAGTSEGWKDTWRVIRYLLEERNADIAHATRDGNNFTKIVRGIATEAIDQKIAMAPDFYAVLKWLDKHPVNAAVATEK